MNVPRELAAPATRLLAAAWPEGAQAAFDPARVQVAGPASTGGAEVTPATPAAGAERLLVLSWIGAHPDASDPLLAALWRLEEAARATGLPVLVLRLAPLVGAHAPGCAHLATRPRLEPKLARALVQPVREDDAVAGMAAVFAGRVAWAGWYEVCGPDALTVGEFAAAAASGALGPIEAAPAWEPAPEIGRAHV